VSWEEEPGEHRWLFRRQGAEVELRILAFSGSWPQQPEAQGTEVFAAQQPLSDLAGAIAGGLRTVLAEWGEDGWRRKWVEYDFPTELLQLVESRVNTA
jgi:hypothetical protein